MSNSNETDILLQELEKASSQPLELDDAAVLDKFLGTEELVTPVVHTTNVKHKSNVNMKSENSEQSSENINLVSKNAKEQITNVTTMSTNPIEQSEVINSASEDANQLSKVTNFANENVDEGTVIKNSPSNNAEEQSTMTESSEVIQGQNEKACDGTNNEVISTIPETSNDVEMSDTSGTISAAESMDVPEIVPNSETHVSEIIMASEHIDAASAELEVKEEMIDDTDFAPEVANTSFNVSPTFEANLDPKFKPTLRLEKIDGTSGKNAEEDGPLTSSSHVKGAEISSDEENSNTTRRPRRSIKTPARLQKGFLLDDSNKKAGKTGGSAVSSKTSAKNVVLQGPPMRIIKSNFIPIKPKPAGGIEMSKKIANITLLKPGVKLVQEVETPVIRQNPNDSIVCSLNSKSVPSILNRPKRSGEQVSPVNSNDLTNTPKATPAKKQKVETPKEPPKKPQRRHRKIFDYESYLREHQEAEVNDKKPKSADINGEPFQLLSSLVGVNVPPSKIKVLPFAKNSTSTLKSKKSNENDSNNIQTKRTERTLYDLMQDISLLLPSWNLHIMPDSNSFCIAQVCRSRSGIPTLKTSIELDSQFNGKVFIHQLHCKRYDGVYDSEESISALIQEIDALSK